MKLLISIFISIFLILTATAQVITPAEKTEQVFGQEGEKYFRFKVAPDIDLSRLGQIISIDKVMGNEVFAYANKGGFEKFLETGLSYQILPHPGDILQAPKMMDVIDLREIEDWDFYPTYEGYLSMMQQFADDYPSICQVFSLGQSIQGREIMVARISDNVGVSENEPQFLYTSSMHGDELTGYVLMLRYINYLLTNYGVNDRITELVDGIDIWINPLANPDGTYAGGNNTVNGARRYNAAWVDINRNFPDPQAGPHPDGNDWQAETLVFMELAENQHFVSSSNLHGGSEVCNYPWDTWSHLTADDDWWVYVCREYADTVHQYGPPGYLTDLENGITNGYAWYTITGGRQDYMNYFHQCREFTLEISTVKTPQPTQLPGYWDYNYRSLLNYMEQCTFGIRGLVKDTVSGWPVQAEIYVVGHEEDSSWVYSHMPNGNFHRLLYEGNYNLKISAPGYFNKFLFNIPVNNREETIRNVWLTPEGVGGIEQNRLSQAIDIYPNPAIDNIRVSAETTVLFYTLYNVEGRKAARSSVYEESFTIPVDKLEKGLYFLRLETRQGWAVKRFLKQ